MDKTQNFERDTSSKAKFQNLFFMHLLFAGEPARPSAKAVQQALEERFGEVGIVGSQLELSSFSIKKYPVAYEEGTVPAQVALGDVQDFQPESIDNFTRSQFWDVLDGEKLLDSCRYKVMIFDRMAMGLPYKERCRLLMDWLETAVALFADCTAVYFPTSGKLLDADQVRRHEIPKEDRFLKLCVNIRYFTIQNSKDEIVDTLGLYAIGLPDVQYHYHGLDPNLVVGHAYTTASYLYQNNAPIKNGETIDGLLNGALSQRVQWRCQYEDALIQPMRVVMDICPGRYAAGDRQ